MENYNAISVKFLGATNTKGARTKVVINGRTKFLPYDYTKNSSMEQAVDYVKSQGIAVEGVLHTHNLIITKS